MIEFLLLLFLSTTLGRHHREQLTIVGLAPFTGYHRHVGAGIEPAVKLALEDINNDRHVLPQYNLTVKWVDTEVSTYKTLLSLRQKNSIQSYIF